MREVLTIQGSKSETDTGRPIRGEIVRARRVIITAVGTISTGIVAFALSGANMIALAAGHVSPFVYFHS
jgi:hypothetical protein